MIGIERAKVPTRGFITRKVYHDCQLPKPEPIMSTYTTGMWWWKKEHPRKRWATDVDAFTFTCSCGAVWDFSPTWSEYRPGTFYCRDPRPFTEVREDLPERPEIEE